MGNEVLTQHDNEMEVIVKSIIQRESTRLLQGNKVLTQHESMGKIMKWR